MKELKKGDFTGIYSSIDGKPLYYTGVFSVMEYDGMPCVFLATDLHNNLTFCRWSQQDLNKRGFTIAPRPVEISKTAMQMIRKAGAVIRWTTAAERKAANTDHKRMSAYIITTAAGDFYTTGTCADVREILKAAQAAPEESTPESCQKSPQEENMRRFTIYTDSNMAGIDSRGAYKTLAEARMRLEKELDEDKTSRGGYIFDELRQKVTAIYNGFNLEKIPEPYRGTPNEYTTKKERAMLESIMNKYSSEPTPATSTEANQDTTTGAQEGPTTAGTTAANETPTTAETAPQDATSEATTAETTTERPETSTAAQDTTGSDTRPPRATEDATTGHAANTSTPANQEPGTAADHPGKAAEAITGRTTPPHHITPATLAKMPQDARNEHRPNKYPPHTPKARHGPHRKPAGIPAAAAKTGEK